MNKFNLRLMRRSAQARLRDAQTLQDADPMGERSDSEYLLSLLAFELLLKCLLRMNEIAPSKRGHHYLTLFEQLPAALQSELLDKAMTRIGPPNELKERHVHVLKTWGCNFIRMRYPHEDYEDVTEGEYSEMGDEWAARGSPEDSAVHVYFPNELFGMVEALLEMTVSLQ
ncbi:hypothetical protein [Paraburkholderia xenovorans]|uniref:hypothetical protein n=1 Tax=Paraburkholderia xenovorans TaxID=36873 RepID=UPI0038B9D639